MAAKGQNRTGGDKSKLHKALRSKGKPVVDREKNMRPRRGEEHSRKSKRGLF